MRFGSRRLELLLIGVFVFYAIALFVPSSDSGYYFELRYGAADLVNSITWQLLVAVMLGLTAWNLLGKRLGTTELCLLAAGLFFVLYSRTLALGAGYST